MEEVVRAGGVGAGGERKIELDRKYRESFNETFANFSLPARPDTACALNIRS